MMQKLVMIGLFMHLQVIVLQQIDGPTEVIWYFTSF